ncbi:lipopolysaccharide assembly protein LapA domain-containing protein [Microvirga rosea]|uniref:lipopolysaccharide assembly protein LapA domain-containing protein n=1 Tax=Microvirga rosea TaxID=2715425 RepID=UPI001D0BAE41|nr:lipopolysaccharide assembly protein LapA domain-containing protein [Microvirga rosea]MCB8819478.1 lipopolysaccharide assembly protein LapA domain-containing protein [Microvirga rosea]
MIRFLKALVLLPVAILIVLLAVANREAVTLSLDPFSRDVPEFATQLPLFAIIFASVMVGVVIGGTATWLAQGKHRRARRQFRREVTHLRNETDRLRSQGQSGSSVPALPTSRTPTF